MVRGYLFLLILVLVSAIYAAPSPIVSDNEYPEVIEESTRKIWEKDGLSWEKTGKEYTEKLPLQKEPHVPYNTLVLNLTFATSGDEEPKMDGIIDQWEAVNTDSIMDQPGKNIFMHDIFAKVVGDKIYLAAKAVGQTSNCDINRFPYMKLIDLMLFIEEGHDSRYGAGSRDFINTPHQEDLKFCTIDLDVGEYVLLGDGYLNSYDPSSNTNFWLATYVNPEQIDFSGAVNMRHVGDNCEMSFEVLVPFSGSDGVYLGGFNDESDLNVWSNAEPAISMVGVRYAFIAGGMSIPPSTEYPYPYAYFTLSIKR